MNDLVNKLGESLRYLRSLDIPKAKFAVIFGTGLGKRTIEEMNIGEEISYADIPNFGQKNGEYHNKRLTFGELNKKKIIVLDGRKHLYEGFDVQEVVYPIHVLGELGVKNLIVTSSVGGVNPEYKPGDLMIVKDHINFTSINPLIEYNDSLGKRFQNGIELYNSKLISLAQNACKEESINIKEGVMFFSVGPSFETVAELEAMKRLGADSVGWSTVPEVIVGNYREMKVLAINCITDSLNGGEQVSLDKILEVANNSSYDLFRIINRVVRSDL